MYDEKADFLHHEKEILDFYHLLEAHQIRVKPDNIILDLGAGQGMHAGFLSNCFNKVYCADVINYSYLYGGEFLKLLNEKHIRNGYNLHLEKITFLKTDAIDLLFKDNLFDFCLSINSFEHIPDPGKSLSEIIRILRFQGYAYISFDPIWTADTGSHFFHRVPEPWAHLVYSDDEFTHKMMQNGASTEEAQEYLTAMNRLRFQDYLRIFKQAEAKGTIEIVHFDSWSGVVSENHKEHKNFLMLCEKSYRGNKEELLIRGLRFIIRKVQN